MLKKLSLAAFFAAAAFPAFGQATLNPQDIYLSILNKTSKLPALSENTATVRIGNGFASYPIPDPSTLHVTMDYAMAADMVSLGTGWATLADGSTPCAAIVLPQTVGAEVDVTCTIPPLRTAQVVDLTVTFVGQDPWTQSYLNFRLDPVANETVVVNQEERLRVTWIEAADLELTTTVLLNGIPVGYSDHTAPMTPVAAVGAQVYDFVSRVTNLGPTTARGTKVNVTHSLGFSDYVFPPELNCEPVQIGTTMTTQCWLPADLVKGDHFDLTYSARLDAPVAIGDVSTPSFNVSVSLAEGFRRPVDLVSTNNVGIVQFAISGGTDVMIEKTLPSGWTSIAAGEPLTYRIEPKYVGNSPLRIVIEDVLPAGLIYQSHSPEDFCDFVEVDGQTFRCEIDVTDETKTSVTSLGALELNVLVDDFDAIVEQYEPDFRFVENAASVAIDPDLETLFPEREDLPVDIFPGNNVSAAPAVMIEEPDPELTAHKGRVLLADGFSAGGRDVQRDFAVVGDELVYEIIVENTGNVGLTDRVIVTDTIPFGLAYTGFDASEGWVCSPDGAGGPINGETAVECVLLYSAERRLGVSASTPPLHIYATVVGGIFPGDEPDANGNMPGEHVRVLLNDANPEGGPGEDFRSIRATSRVEIDSVERSTDLEVLKEREHASVETGAWQTYTITVKNNGYWPEGEGTGTHEKFTAQSVTLLDRLDNLFVPFAEAADGAGGVDRVVRFSADNTYADLEQVCEFRAPSSAPSDPYAAELFCRWDEFAYCEVGGSAPACPVIKIDVRQGAVVGGGAVENKQPNRALVYSDVTPEPNYGNNTAVVEHTIPERFDLTIEKVTDLQLKPTGINAPFRYTLRVTNLLVPLPAELEAEFADFDLDDVRYTTRSKPFTITDHLPEGLRITDVTASGGISCSPPTSGGAWVSQTGSEIICSADPGLTAGQVKNVTITAEAPTSMLPELEASPGREITRLNTAEVSFEEGDVNPDNHEAEVEIKIVDGSYDLAIQKTVDQAMLRSGDIASFTLTIDNVGTSRAEHVMVTDGLPDPTLFKFDRAEVVEGIGACGAEVAGKAANFDGDPSGTAEGEAGAGTKVVCSVGDLAPGQTAKVRVFGQMMRSGSEPNFTSVIADRNRTNIDPTLWTDDANYENNSDFTSVTAQELVDLKMTKTALPSTTAPHFPAGPDDEPPARTYFNVGDTITFLLAVENISKTSGSIYPPEFDAMNDLVEFYTDASDVKISDTLPSNLAFTGAMRIINGPQTLCTAPAAGTRDFECTVPLLLNGEQISVELDTVVVPPSASGTGANPGYCQTLGCAVGDGKSYFTLSNSASVEAPGDVETSVPPEDTTELRVILSSISGRYWWDLQKNSTDFSGTDLDFNAAEGDSPVEGRQLILKYRADSSSEWVTMAQTTTDATGNYKFDYLLPGEYQVVDGTTFDDKDVSTQQIEDANGVDRDAIIGVVTVGNIPGQASTDYGSAAQRGDNTRGIGSIVLGEDKHGVEYNLRIVPVPKLLIDKSVETSTLWVNGILEVTYKIVVTNDSLEPLTNVVLTDPLSTVFTAHSPALQELMDDPELVDARDLGAGIYYAAAVPVISAVASETSAPPTGSQAAAANPNYLGVAQSSDEIFSAPIALAAGGKITVRQRVLVNLGQPPHAGSAAEETTYTNTANVKGTGAYSGFEHEGEDIDGTDRTTPTLDVSDPAEVTPELAPAVTLVKTLVDRSRLSALHTGKLVYAFTITNSGNVPLKDITLVDELLGIEGTDRAADLALLTTDLNGTLASVAMPPQLSLLLAGESLTLYGTYELTAENLTALEDADSITLTNTATVRGYGTDPDDPVTDEDEIDADVGVQLTKTIISRPTSVVAGQVLTYHVTVENLGQLPYLGAVLEDDVLLDSDGTLSEVLDRAGVRISGPETDLSASFDLAVGELRTYVFTYEVTQADIDAQDVDPDGHPLLQNVAGVNTLINTVNLSGTFTGDPNEPTTRTDDEDYPLTPVPAFASAKFRHVLLDVGATDPDGAPMVYPEDRVVYAVLVTNTGNTSISSVSVSDNLLGITGLEWTATAQAGTEGWLEPGQSILFRDADFVVADSQPAIASDAVIFDTVVTDGAVRMMLELTAAMIDAETLTNTAEVSVVPVVGEDPEPQEPSTTETFDHVPAIELEKTTATAGPVGFDENGIASVEVTYEFTVVNTGNVTLTDVYITDPLILAVLGEDAGGLPQDNRLALADLAPGDRVETSTSVLYVLDPEASNYAALVAMLDSGDGILTNTAEVEGLPPPTTAVPDPDPVRDESSSTVPVVTEPGIEITKSGVEAPEADWADPQVPEVIWTITVVNTGSVTLDDISFEDPRAGTTITVPEALGPQQSWDYSFTLATNLAERDAGEANNSLTNVTTTTPGDDPFTPADPDPADPVPLTEGVASIEIDKSDDPFFAVDGGNQLQDSELKYYFRIRNTGTVTLTDLDFEDGPLFASVIDGLANVPNDGTILDFDITLPDQLLPVRDVLAQKASDTPDAPLDLAGYADTGWYSIGSITVKIDLDTLTDGTIENNADITGTPPRGDPVKDNDPEITPLDQAPDFTARKTGALVMADEDRGTREGDHILWTVEVENTGNITLNGLTVSEADFIATYGAFETVTAVLVEDREGVVTTTPLPLLAPGDPAQAGEVNLVDQGDTIEVSGLKPGYYVRFVYKTAITEDLFAQVIADPVTPWSMTNTVTVYDEHDYPPGHPKEGETWTKTEEPDDSVDFVPLSEYDVQKTASADASIQCVMPAEGSTVTNPLCRIGFAITVTNTGNIALDTLEVTEVTEGMVFLTELPAGTPLGYAAELDADGRVFTAATPLAAGASLTLYSAYEIDYPPTEAQLAVLNAGKVVNLVSVEASSEDPEGGDPIVSEETPESDPEAEGSVTQLPSIELVKEPVALEPLAGEDGGVATETGGQLSYEGATPQTRIGYRFTVTNTGNVTLTDVVLTDERLLGVGVSVALGDLDPQETVTWVSEANTDDLAEALSPTQAELDAGAVVNTAQVKGTFEDEDVPDEDEVTVTLIPVAGLSLVKTGVMSDDGLSILYTFEVENTGNVTLTDIVLTDPLLGDAWEYRFPAETKLAPGDAPLSFTLDEAYVLTATDRANGWVLNTAYVNGTPDTENPDVEPPEEAEDTVIISVPGTPELTLVKAADDTEITVPPEVGQKIWYTLTLTNTGEVPVSNIVVTDALGADFIFVDEDRLPVLDGGELAELGVGDSHEFYGYYALRQQDLDAGRVINTATVDGEWVPEEPPPGSPEFGDEPPTNTPVQEPSTDKTTGDPETITELIMKGEFLATKAADMERVFLGDTVTYTLTFTSQSTGMVQAVDLIDVLPKGLIYTPNSAEVTVSGRAAELLEPQVAGRSLIWTVNEVPRQGVITVRFKVRVSQLAPYGKLTNKTWSQTPEGEKNSNTATATVIREPEHVFECSDVTGKVFEDYNHNGRQDPMDRSALTSDDQVFGKFEKYDELPREPRDERGLPGVRLVTPTGTVITTDKHGRYSVPCAELPRDLGTNFTLKLDTRSLPTGYRVTTENPRTLALTAGKAAEMNFGVSMSKLVRLDLSAAAFVAGKAEMAPALNAAIEDFLRTAKAEPVVLHLGYHLGKGESRDLARKRLDLIEKALVKGMKGRKSNLLIERSYTQTGK